MKLNKLKPCPFCGGKAKLGKHTEEFPFSEEENYFFVRCTNCGCMPFRFSEVDREISKQNLKDQAIITWNIRIDELKMKELAKENESLKQCMEHEHHSFMETFGELDDKCKRLTEENERLHATCTEFERKCASLNDENERLKDENERLKADTVRSMRSRIKARCIAGGIYPAFVENIIDQITKEMLEEYNAHPVE